jgi:pimeloyl-ACP methyl ester carboxylesterase
VRDNPGTLLPSRTRPVSGRLLLASDHFAQEGGTEIFIKKIETASPGGPWRGPVIMAAGIASNADMFRIAPDGGFLKLNNTASFANLLASEGFSVYLYNPSFTERLHNRYVATSCPASRYFGKTYKAPANLKFSGMVDTEIPQVVDYVARDSGTSSISWVGFSMGGMLIYAYLAKHGDIRVKNVVTIGSPITLNQIFVRFIPLANMATRGLGFEEGALLSGISKNLVPITSLIRRAPGWMCRYFPATLLLWNPGNISAPAVKTLIGDIVEPIPLSLQECFTGIIEKGLDCEEFSPNLMKAMSYVKRERTNFLFFFGQYDMIAPPDTVLLAHEVLTPVRRDNMIGVRNAGHLDLAVGRKAPETVWKPTLEWLKEKDGKG